MIVAADALDGWLIHTIEALLVHPEQSAAYLAPHFPFRFAHNSMVQADQTVGRVLLVTDLRRLYVQRPVSLVSLTSTH